MVKMGYMTDQKEQMRFLRESGYELMRNRMLGSLTLKQFLISIEN